MTYKVMVVNNRLQTSMDLGTYESKIEALEVMEQNIDDDLMNGDYETYDYYINGELYS